MNLEQLYRIRCEQPSSIHLHLPTLRKYAEQCNKVTELGVQGGVSTTAFLAAQPQVVHSYDIKFDLCLLNLIGAGTVVGAFSTDFTMVFNDTVWKYFLADSIKIEIGQTDLLFIDTLHTYIQLREELAMHHSKVNKWIILHDTESYGEHSEGWQDIVNPSAEQVAGLNRAIKEFIDENYKQWKELEVFKINNGLTVLERR